MYILMSFDKIKLNDNLNNNFDDDVNNFKIYLLMQDDDDDDVILRWDWWYFNVKVYWDLMRRFKMFDRFEHIFLKKY